MSVTGADKKQRDGSNRPSRISDYRSVRDHGDPRARLLIARICVRGWRASSSARTATGEPVRAADLQATGPMMALLSEALLPNLVQTTEGTPATGALRAVCEHRARHQFGDLAADGAAAGRLRGERDRLRLGPGL